MEKIKFQTAINLLFLTVMTGFVFSSCKNSKEEPLPVTRVLKDIPYLSPVHNKEIIEIKVELIGNY